MTQRISLPVLETRRATCILCFVQTSTSVALQRTMSAIKTLRAPIWEGSPDLFANAMTHSSETDTTVSVSHAHPHQTQHAVPCMEPYSFIRQFYVPQ